MRIRLGDKSQLMAMAAAADALWRVLSHRDVLSIAAGVGAGAVSLRAGCGRPYGLAGRPLVDYYRTALKALTSPAP